MSDGNRKPSSGGAVEQILRNMTSEVRGPDGQYVQLGFTPPASPQETWNVHQPPFVGAYGMPLQEHQVQYPMEHQYQQQQFGGFRYRQDLFDKRMSGSGDMSYAPYPHGVQDIAFTPDYKLFMNMSEHPYVKETQTPNAHPFIQQGPDGNVINNIVCPNRTPLIDNLVGNLAPNTCGTYSPFGNVNAFNNPTTNIFEPQDINNILPETKPEYERSPQPEEVSSFQFSRDNKKPRMVAEVKPMRPSYCDVLLKSAPTTQTPKSSKTDPKEPKKKETGKKTLKTPKATTLNRSNTSNEIPEKHIIFPRASEKSAKDAKPLTRKWASLDNVTDSSSSDFIKTDLSDSKKVKKTVDGNAKLTAKVKEKKVGKNETNEVDTSNGCKSEVINLSKTTVRKTAVKVGRQKVYDSSFGENDRPPGKRSQRTRKRENQVPFGIVGLKIKEYLGWWKYIVKFLFWLFHLVSDILSLSAHLMKDVGSNLGSWLVIHWALFLDTSIAVMKRIRFLTWIYEKFKKEKEPEKKQASFLHQGPHNNINMPTTGEEAMKRLLACKDKDPYSILGVTPMCTDSDIKNYYKKQAKLVHPDKNQQPGAEEAFKILVHAFDMIGEPERRASYDRGVAESAQAEQAMSELTELLVQLQQKVEAAANTIRCSACGSRHKRVKVERQVYAARNCNSCRIRHAAREGDIWAEACCFGFLWYYYACMDGGVYDITEWAGCQKNSLKHLRPDSHNVQYRIALGRQSGGPSRRHPSAPRPDRGTPDLDSLFSGLYGQAAGGDGGSQQQGPARRRTRKTK